MTTVFISGHLDLTQQEFDEHYDLQIRLAVLAGAHFVIGDARGTDTMAQSHLTRHAKRDDVYVFHMFDKPRNNVGMFPTCGGYKSDDERDAAMTAASDYDIAWVRPGREKSGTQKNID